MKKAIRIFLPALALVLGLKACTSPQPAQYARPMGNLGDTVNSAGNDFAALIPGGRGDTLYFTSDRRGAEELWRVALRGNERSPDAASLTQDRSSLFASFARPGKNLGSAAFLPPVNGAPRGFLALSHAPEADAASGLYAAGGTDIFEFSQKGPADRPEFFALPEGINSKFWDSHPAAASRGDSLLLVFSSDRPAAEKGFSSPYAQAKTLVSGDTVLGNSDLYYCFRINGKWSPVRNFDEAGGMRLVNTAANEYSPFIHCITHKPVLLFASNREGRALDIFAAELNVDFAAQTLSILTVNPMQQGADEINSGGNEIFPFIAGQQDTGSQFMYLASDRDLSPRQAGKQLVRALGAYDLYRFPVELECRPPQISYRVRVLDRENPSRPVASPVIEMVSDDGRKQRFEQESAELMLSPENRYTVRAASLFDKIDCNGTDRVISHYAFRRVRLLQPEIRSRVVNQSYDTLEAAVAVTVYDTLLTKETVPIAEAARISSNEKGAVQSIEVQGENLIVSRVRISSRTEMTGGKKRTLTRRETVYDTIPRFDTSFVRTTESMALSAMSSAGSFEPVYAARDTVLEDTVWLEPRYYTFPPCRWEFVENIEDYRRNVPYFQTGFWEVNTSENLRRQLPEFSDDRYNGASFIELYPSNQYFGFRPDMDEEQRALRRQKRATRIANYQGFARNVDRNLAQMVENIAGNILPKFEELRLKMPEDDNKMLVQILAYSDVRPVVRGWYTGSESISYLSGNYETASGRINIGPVSIRPGASLVGENNDTLSKLRAFFGYREVMKRLEKDSLFAQYVRRGEVLFPAAGMTPDEFRRRAEKARIIIMAEGRYTDTGEKPELPGYQRKPGDYYELDDVRRIDVIVSRVEVHDGKVIQSPCCSPAQAENLPR